MRVSKERAAENRDALLNAASRLFRKRGIDDVGVAEVAKEAGLTHGALYAHFPSKDALAAEAFSHGFAGNMKKARARGANAAFKDHLDALFSPGMRDRPETGCPMAASASEIGRQGPAVSASFAGAFEEMAAMIESSLDKKLSKSQKRRLAVATVAAQIGAIAASRAVAKTNKALADEVLKAVHETVASANSTSTIP